MLGLEESWTVSVNKKIIILKKRKLSRIMQSIECEAELHELVEASKVIHVCKDAESTSTSGLNDDGQLDNIPTPESVQCFLQPVFNLPCEDSSLDCISRQEPLGHLDFISGQEPLGHIEDVPDTSEKLSDKLSFWAVRFNIKHYVLPLC
nr:uncharacterized protein LOC122268795 [Parasteatoda tepidariorum]